MAKRCKCYLLMDFQAILPKLRKPSWSWLALWTPLHANLLVVSQGQPFQGSLCYGLAGADGGIFSILQTTPSCPHSSLWPLLKWVRACKCGGYKAEAGTQPYSCHAAWLSAISVPLHTRDWALLYSVFYMTSLPIHDTMQRCPCPASTLRHASSSQCSSAHLIEICDGLLGDI